MLLVYSIQIIEVLLLIFYLRVLKFIERVLVYIHPQSLNKVHMSEILRRFHHIVCNIY